jgi:transcriptional regulator with PAS, ATPase and Fis domain
MKDSVLVVGELRGASRAIAAICDCSANLHRVQDLAELPKLTASVRCSVALVCLGKSVLPGAALLEAIRDLSERGFTVLTCGNGANRWSFQQKCLPLLAGAAELLDLTAENFFARMRSRLKASLQAAAVCHAEQQQQRKIMNSLGVVGASQAMLSIFRVVLRISQLSDVPVLLTGETGTGKGLLAHAIYRLDPKRRTGPFVVVNCGAVSAGLAESELFGHRRGAFTGSTRDRKGLFHQAEGGVIFLDEVADMERALQVKLLRVLEERRVLRVGEDVERPVDVRVLAATNRDLTRIVADKVLRSDLFHRLNVLRIDVPPLRERPSDICPLIFHFLEKHRSLGPGGEIALEPDFIDALGKIELSGNVRQLEHIMCQVLANRSNASALTLRDLPPEVLQELAGHTQDVCATEIAGSAVEVGAPLSAPVGDWQLHHFLDSCERRLLEKALQETCGNQSKTARLLGITPRSVYNKLRKHELRLKQAHV